MDTLNEMSKENEAIKKIVEEIEKNPPEDKNNGYHNLMNDLTELLKEASEYEFDDFRNKKYATPKLALADKLTRLIQLTKNGRYDN